MKLGLRQHLAVYLPKHDRALRKKRRERWPNYSPGYGVHLFRNALLSLHRYSAAISLFFRMLTQWSNPITNTNPAVSLCGRLPYSGVSLPSDFLIRCLSDASMKVPLSLSLPFYYSNTISELAHPPVLPVRAIPFASGIAVLSLSTCHNL